VLPLLRPLVRTDSAAQERFGARHLEASRLYERCRQIAQLAGNRAASHAGKERWRLRHLRWNGSNNSSRWIHGDFVPGGTYLSRFQQK
jgi:hypothetical protein